MTVSDALDGITRLGMDTSPFIYYLEDKPPYADLCELVFRRITAGQITAYTSMVTLTETLVHPLRNGDAALEAEYLALLSETEGITSLPVDSIIARRAAGLRARYALRTPDALQLATAIGAGCEAFLTNDRGLRRVMELRVLVLDELTI